MKISIVVPTYNESDHIIGLLNYLSKHAQESVGEILVIDGFKL